MAELIIDLSGKGGLADDFHGDTDMVTPQPELRMAKTGGDIVSGMFNPDLRKGYLAPVTTSSTSLTIDTPPTTVMGSVEYDYLTGEVIWADRENNIFVGSSLIDTTITLTDTLVDASFTNQKYDEIHDLQIYQLNGERELFFVGKGVPLGLGPEQIIATNDTANSYVGATISIESSSTTKPSVLASERAYYSGAHTVITDTITVPSGTDTVLIAVVMNSTNVTTSTCKFGTVSMDLISEKSLGPSLAVYALANPSVSTDNVEVVFSASTTERLLYSYVLDNVHQTEIGDADITRLLISDDVTDIPITPDFIDKNQHLMWAAFSKAVLTPDDSTDTELGTEYFNTTNTWGSDAMYEVTTTGYGLQVGHAVMPFTQALSTDSSWLASQALGGFLQELDTDYAFMRTADNGFAYIFADNHVHKIDGTITGGEDGTVTKDVLLFPDYFRITDAIDYRSRLFIAIHQYPVDVATTTLNTYIGNCGIYIWNRISAQLTSADYIQLPGVREIKKIYASPDGQLKLLIISDDGLVELRQFGYNDSGGVVFSSNKTFGIGAFPQFSDGLTAAGDRSVWIGNDGKMYAEKANMITQLFQIKAPGTTSATLATNIETGAMLYGSGDETADAGYRSNKQAITFSYVDGSTQYLKKIYPFDLKDGSNTAQAQAQGDVYSGVNLIPMTSDVKNIRIYNAPTTGTGTDVIATVKVYFNQSTTASMPSGMTKSISKDEAKRGYVDFKINKQYINSVQIEVEWSTSINLGVDTYLPSVAVVLHEATTTQSPDNG